MKTQTKWLLAGAGVVAGFVVLAGGLTVAYLVFRAVTGWGTVRVPEGSLSYPDLLAAVQQTAPVDGLVMTSEPRLHCGGDVFMCSNDVRFEYEMPYVSDAEGACDIAYRQLRRMGEGPIVILSNTDDATEDYDSFIRQCIPGLESNGSLFSMAGSQPFFGNSSIWMRLDPPYSGANPDAASFSGQITMQNQLPLFARTPGR